MPPFPPKATSTRKSWADRLRFCLAEGNLLGAEEAAAALLQKESNNEELHYTVGLALFRTMMPRLALPHLERAAAGGPANHEVQRTYGAALLDAGEFSEARRVLEGAVARNGKDPRVLHLLGRLNAQTDQRDLAEGFYRKAIALSPGPRRADLENQLLDLRLSWGDLDGHGP